MAELRHLRYFVAVAEELNFSRAARRLHMAQPPLSVAIRQLEAEIGAELFHRSTREVTLTEAGRVLLDGARRTLVEAEAAVAAARRAAAGELGALRLGFSWSVRFETLPALGQAFRARRPDVELLTEEIWNFRMVGALRDGTIDLAVALCPEVAGDLTYRPIRRERIVALLPATHPLAGEPALDVGALANEQLVLFPRELAPRLYDSVVAFCRLGGFEPTIRNESFHAVWELGVMSDVPLIALAPASVTQALPEGVLAVSLEPQEHLEVSLVWRSDDASPVLAAFVEVASGVFDTESILA
jgi:DNA-binding transcriptional LysR family regulator